MKCKDCKFCQEQYLTPVQGQGIYRFAYCEWLVYDPILVDSQVERECRWFKWFEEKIDKLGKLSKKEAKI